MENQSQEPSLLEYARFYRIAADITATSPLQYIDQTCKVSKNTTAISNSTDEPSKFDIQLSSTRAEVEETLRKEKLNVSKDDAYFLTTVIRNTKTSMISIDWDSLLRGSRERDLPGKLELELPLWMKDDETSLKNRYKHHILFDINEESPNTLTKGDELEFLDNTFREANDLAQEIQAEKLDCPMDSLRWIQSIRQYTNPGPGGLEKLFESILGHEHHRTRKDVLLRPMQFNDTRETPPLNKMRMLPSPTSSDIIISKAGPELSPTRQTPHYGHNNPQDRPGGSGIFWKPSFQYQSSWDRWSTLAVEQLDLTSPSSENEYKGRMYSGPFFYQDISRRLSSKGHKITNVGQRNTHKHPLAGYPVKKQTYLAEQVAQKQDPSDLHKTVPSETPIVSCDGKISTRQPQTTQSKKRNSNNKETSSKKGRKSCIQDLGPSSNPHSGQTRKIRAFAVLGLLSGFTETRGISIK